MNYKRKKPKDHSKVYRGGVDGPDCGYCGSNWKYARLTGTKSIEWELLLDYCDGT